MVDVQKSVGVRVREAREKGGLSQQALAEIVDLSTSHIGQIERGERNASMPSIRRIAEALGVPLKNIVEAQEAHESRASYESNPKWRQLMRLAEGMDEEILDIFLRTLRLFKRQRKEASR